MRLEAERIDDDADRDPAHRADFGGTVGDFKQLIAWQKAHAFTIAVHAAFRGRRSNVSPGLRAQILRAVNSVPDNLAEGCAKRSRRELASYADVA